MSTFAFRFPFTGRTTQRTSPTTARSSRTASLLIHLFGWGVIGATIVQQIADAVMSDIQADGGHPPESIVKLASLGSSGFHSQNCRRDMWRWLKPALALIPEPLYIRVPYCKARSMTRHVVEYMTIPIMMPNLLIEFFYQRSPLYFEKLKGVGLKQCWSQVLFPNIACRMRKPLETKPLHTWRLCFLMLALCIRHSKLGIRFVLTTRRL